MRPDDASRVTVKSTPPALDEGRAADRRRQIITEAARLFARKGFEATSMREIAAAAGILAGSLYYHFASKEELFVAVHGAGMEAVERAVREALEGIEAPWNRLEAAAAAHAGALFSVAEIVTIVTPKFPASIGRLRGELVRQRDAYERLMADLVDALELPESVNRKMFRLQFLGALNWMQTWYQRDGKLTPQELGRQIVAVLRHGYERPDNRMPKT